MIAPWLVALIVSVVLNVAAVLITPKPKAPKPGAVEQAQAPTASAGRPMPLIFGTATITETNVLWFGRSGARQYEVSA